MSIDVLGYLVEVVSGMPLDKFFQERIFSPLGMKDTWFYLPENLIPRLVEIHVPHDGKWVKAGPNLGGDPYFPISGSKTHFSGGGGLSSTAMDYAKFLQMYLNGGEYNGVRILSRKTIELNGNEGIYHGLAFAVTSEKTISKGGLGSVGTFEWGGAFNTQYFADPKENLIGIIMKQTLGVDENTGGTFKQMVYTLIDE
jgi:CubicO group peptidase (beta-lactamase class C family)